MGSGSELGDEGATNMKELLILDGPVHLHTETWTSWMRAAEMGYMFCE